MKPSADEHDRTSDKEVRSKALTEKIIGCAYTVSNELGCGFLEKVYENALAHELRKQGMRVEQQPPLNVYYDGTTVGVYFADLVVGNEVIVELKCAKCFEEAHLAQCLNYLRGCGMYVALLLNFGSPRVEVKRVINDR